MMGPEVPGSRVRPQAGHDGRGAALPPLPCQEVWDGAP